MPNAYLEVVVTDDCKSFAVLTFAALVVVVLVDEAAVVVPHCELVVVLEFDAVAAYVVDVLDSHIVVAFHLAVYLVVVAALILVVELKFMLMLFFWFFPFFKRC